MIATRLIYGTAWKGNDTGRLVEKALDAGFRSFDTAPYQIHYREDLVGEGLRSILQLGLIRREELHIQTKFSWTKERHDEYAARPRESESTISSEVKTSVERSLALLAPDHATGLEGTPYLDCVLLHSPLPTWYQNLEAWKALETFVPKRVRSIGVCNTPLPFLRLLYNSNMIQVKPKIVQNPFTAKNKFDFEVRAFCRDNSIAYQAFWVLTANEKLLSSRPVILLASETGLTVQEALYYFVTSFENVTALDGTSQEHRMKDDISSVKKVDMWKSQSLGQWDKLWTEFNDFIEQMAADGMRDHQ